MKHSPLRHQPAVRPTRLTGRGLLDAITPVTQAAALACPRTALAAAGRVATLGWRREAP